MATPSTDHTDRPENGRSSTPQIQFLDRVDDVHVSVQRQTLEVPQMPCIDKVVDMRVVMPRHVSMNQKVQKTVETPEIQFTDRVIHVPVMAQREVHSAQRVQKTVEVLWFFDLLVDATIQTAQKTDDFTALEKEELHRQSRVS